MVELVCSVGEQIYLRQKGDSWFRNIRGADSELIMVGKIAEESGGR